MIRKMSHATIFVNNQEEALSFIETSSASKFIPTRWLARIFAGLP